MQWGAVMQNEVDGFETPINLCNHAYWNLSGDFAESTIADHLISLNSDRVFRFNEQQLPTDHIDLV
jgi:galactose mutarotase-like enzyme